MALEIFILATGVMLRAQVYSEKYENAKKVREYIKKKLNA
ncbi:unnamed protein product [marine sediment metagenome]|uniref:Uncharacterized protein n=1 Tax=marine sediment metagenome TaxID=412755 RepID=X1JCR2_9ZZZZ